MASTAKDYSQRRLGGGKLYIDEYDDQGVLTGEEWFGITENLVQTVEQEFITIDNTEGCQILEDAKILSKTTVTLAWDTKNISPVNLARAFLGDKTENTVVAGTGADVTDPVVLDVAIPLDFKFATNIVVQDETDLITYTLGTDYTVDDSGATVTVTPITGGAITALDILHIGYDYAEYTDGLIKALQNASLSGKLRFAMCNSQGFDYEITYHKADISSAGDFSLKANEDAGMLSFTASVVKLDTVDNLFEIEYAELTGA